MLFCRLLAVTSYQNYQLINLAIFYKIIVCGNKDLERTPFDFPFPGHLCRFKLGSIYWAMLTERNTVQNNSESFYYTRQNAFWWDSNPQYFRCLLKLFPRNPDKQIYLSDCDKTSQLISISPLPLLSYSFILVSSSLFFLSCSCCLPLFLPCSHMEAVMNP